MKEDISQEQTMDIIFLTHCEGSQPEDVEGRVSSVIHSIYKNGYRAGCFFNMSNTHCSTRNSKRDGSDPCIGTWPPGSSTLSSWKKQAACCQDLMRNTSYIVNTSDCAKAAEHITHAVWAGNPLVRRDSRSTEVLLLLCLLDTFAYSCVSATAISSALPLTVCWVLTQTGRWEEGAREGGSKKMREGERGSWNKKTLKPLVIFSDKSWHPVFIASAAPNFCFRVAKKAKAVCRLFPSAPAEQE